MRRLFWVDGRLSWPLVISIVFMTVSLVCFDLAWRLLTMPFDTFFVYAVLVEAAAVIVLVAVYRQVRRH